MDKSLILNNNFVFLLLYIIYIYLILNNKSYDSKK